MSHDARYRISLRQSVVGRTRFVLVGVSAVLWAIIRASDVVGDNASVRGGGR